MRKLTLNGHAVTIFDSIDELPIVNFSRYNKFLLIDSGIGSTLEDIDAHIEKVAQFIPVNTKNAIQELQNLRQAMYFVMQEVSPKHLAFAALIIDIDDVKVSNVSDDILHELLKKLNGTKNSDITSLLEDIKKKINFEFAMYFPLLADNPDEKYVYELLKKRTVAILDGIIANESSNDSVDAIDLELLKFHEPKSFSGKDSVEISYIKDYEKACILISSETGLKSTEMTTLQFYLALEQIKKEQKQWKANQSNTRI